MYVAILHTLCVQNWCIIFLIYESFVTFCYLLQEGVDCEYLTVTQRRTSLCVPACACEWERDGKCQETLW